MTFMSAVKTAHVEFYWPENDDTTEYAQISSNVSSEMLEFLR